VKRVGIGAVAAAVLLGVLFAVIALVLAPTAAAHSVRIATDPAVDAVLTLGPTQVSATFNETLQPAYPAMTVVGPDGNLWSTGEPKIDGAVISVDVRPLGPTGTYTVNYRVTSADGHPVSGSWAFRLTVAGTGTPGPPAQSPAAAGANGSTRWMFIGIGAAVAAGLGIASWMVYRRRADG
jgi:methionine-rich copper-binding protein CopC